jgi:hypothetical protein
MTDGRRFDIASMEEAKSVLEHFNQFHDGFIKRITVVSQDEMGEDYSQSSRGIFDIELEFAHYNYTAGAQPLHPARQRVWATFYNVRDLFYDVQEGYEGNTIQHLAIHLPTQPPSLKLRRPTEALAKVGEATAARPS